MNALAPMRLDHQRPARRLLNPWVVLMALSAGLAGVAGLMAFDLNAQTQSLQQRIALARNAANPPAARPPDARSLKAARAAAQLSQVQRELGIPWDALFGSLEAAASNDVGLLSMRTVPEQHSLKLDGEARDMNALLEFMRQLRAQELFIEVNLHSHHVEQADPQRALRFALTLKWKEAQ